MKRKALPLMLGLAASFLMAPVSQAAGMIVIDPIVGGAMPVIRPPVGRPGHSNLPNRPFMLKGQVSFGLRMESEDVRVEIVDQVAKTYITQTFFNDTDRNLAGTYLFPLPEDTTFSSFSLHIDGKPVEGKILEAKEARAQYEAIVRQMIDPGLLEYADYKTVRARIFPIPAHGSKKVELEYTQVLKAENGLIKYNFPLKSEQEAPPAEEININVKLSSKQGLRTIWSPSHVISAKRDGEHKALAAYAGKDVVPNKDFLLYYSVSDKEMTANLLTNKSESEDGYFLMTLTPPVQAKEIASKDIVFVADTSGSMRGKRMDENKRALKYLVNALSPADRFSVVQFNSDVDAFKTAVVPATPQNKKAALAFIDDLEAAGGTNIGDALKMASGMLGAAKERPSYLVLMTDGEPTVGETTVPGLLKAVDARKDIRVFDFGVGYDVNTKLLNRLAESNHGTSQYVEPEESMEIALSNFYDKIKSPVLSNVKLSIEGVQVKEMYPREVKDIFAGSQIMLLGKYKGGGNGVCKLSGTVNGQAKSFSFPLKFESQQLGHSYLPRLWAMRRIAHLTEVAQDNGENREIIDEIVALSKKHGIISNYTSFLVTEPNEASRRPVPMASPMPMDSFARTAGGGGGGAAAVRGRLMSKMVAPSAPSVASRRNATAYYNAPRQMQILDEKPVLRDFREGATGFSAQSSGASSYMGSGDGLSHGYVGSSEAFESIAPSDVSAGLRKAARETTGRSAVVASKKLNSLKDTVAVYGDEDKQAAGVKTVADKTFYMRGSYWVDSSYIEGKSGKVKEVTFGSNEYFELIKNVPGISKYLSVGRQLILVYQGNCYKISFKQGA